MKDMLVALFAALIGYLISKYQDSRKDKKQRVAVASAMMAECGDISKYLKALSEHSGDTVSAVLLPMPVREIFNEHLHLFSPSTFSTVALFGGRVDELRNLITLKNSTGCSTVTLEQIRNLARILLQLCACAMVKLHEEGAITPINMAFKDIVEVHAAAIS